MCAVLFRFRLTAHLVYHIGFSLSRTFFVLFRSFSPLRGRSLKRLIYYTKLALSCQHLFSVPQAVFSSFWSPFGLDFPLPRRSRVSLFILPHPIPLCQHLFSIFFDFFQKSPILCLSSSAATIYIEDFVHFAHDFRA